MLPTCLRGHFPPIFVADLKPFLDPDLVVDSDPEVDLVPRWIQNIKVMDPELESKLEKGKNPTLEPDPGVES